MKSALLAVLMILASSLRLCAQSPADRELQNFQLDRLERTLQAMPSGAERDYFAGMIANRRNQISQSVALLTRALPALRKSNSAHAALALQALADDDTKQFQYAAAAKAYEDLLGHFAAQLSPDQVQGTKDDAAVAGVLRAAPPQTIAWHGAVRVRIGRNPLGSWNAVLKVNHVTASWLLDTGANMSAVSRSFARRLGLKPLPGTAQTQAGVTGIENPIQIALVPVLHVGGATLHNLVVLILEDASLRIDLGPRQRFQIQAVLGYPAFQAMGAIAFRNDGWFEAGDAARAEASASGSSGTTMYMKLLMPVIECGVGGEELPFSFDTGASGTNLTERYAKHFRALSASWKKGENKSAGAGGIVTRTIYLQPDLRLAVGNRTATLHNVPIFTQPMGSDLDELYGNLGQDMVSGFSSFVVDFSRMRFTLGAPLPPQPHPRRH